MHFGQFVFSQVMEMIHRQEFARCVERYNGDYKVQHFSCRDQFLCMAFAQLTFRESLRDIEAALNSRPEHLYHLGLAGLVARTTLAQANEQRDWRIYADLARGLIARARELYAHEPLDIELAEPLYALDATVIDLCLSLYPWARFRRTKGAIKVHTELNLRGEIPNRIHITTGKCHDVNWLDELTWEAGSIYVMDRGYVDFGRLHRLAKAGAFFVIRAKARLRFRVLSSRSVDLQTGLRCDQTIRLTGQRTAQEYPEALRRIVYVDPETHKRLVFLTNHWDLPALTVANIYRLRWRVELFFKWIKQNLRIKVFYGTSDNAVKTQIWIAVCVFVLIAILKKELQLQSSPATILSILSVNIFEKVPLAELLTEKTVSFREANSCNQLMLNI